MDVTSEKGWQPWQSVFIKWLARKGNVAAACGKAKISRQHAYRIREEDAAFAAAWQEALEIATERLEMEARRRAEDGVRKPVYQGGELVGYIREYSDTLLIFLLKAHKPEKYREHASVELAGKGGGPIQAAVHVYIPDNGRGDRDG